MAPKRLRGRRDFEAETSSGGTGGGSDVDRKRLRLLHGGRADAGSGEVLVRPSGRAPATALDPRLAGRDPRELLRRLLAPMEPKEFLRRCWARSAVVVHGPPARCKPIIRDFMCDLDLASLLQETPTEGIHAWVRPAEGARSPEATGSSPAPVGPAPAARRDAPPLESVTVDAEAALGLSRAGAALYFRAPEELESLLVPGLCTALGSAFAGVYPGDGKPRGEIETFIAGRGHVTGWHTDFQHNFTIQLRGAKTWRFKRGPVEHNLRALTPHYNCRSNYEQQMKLHLMSDPLSPAFRPPDSFFEDAEEVTTVAGSVLYHPAGVWHHVECVSDSSVSINVSLTMATWADVIGDALRQLLWASPALRAPIVGLAGELQRARNAAEAALCEARRRAGALVAEDLLPPAMVEADRPPRRVNVATSRLGATLAVRPADRFRFSRLAVVVQLPQGRRDAAASSSSSCGSEDDADFDSGSMHGSSTHHAEGELRGRPVGAGARRLYALHVNFGNEDVASWLRLRLAVSQPFLAAMEWLRNRHLAARRAEEALARAGPSSRGASPSLCFPARDLLNAATPRSSDGAVAATARRRAAARWTRIARLLRVLCHCGYLQKVRAGHLGHARAGARGAAMKRRVATAAARRRETRRQ